MWPIQESKKKKLEANDRLSLIDQAGRQTGAVGSRKKYCKTGTPTVILVVAHAIKYKISVVYNQL